MVSRLTGEPERYKVLQKQYEGLMARIERLEKPVIATMQDKNVMMAEIESGGVLVLGDKELYMAEKEKQPSRIIHYSPQAATTENQPRA